MRIFLVTKYLLISLRTHDGDLNQISTITKCALNKLTGSCQVSIQEAMHKITGLDLIICSDYLTDDSLGHASYLQKESSYTFLDLISSYHNRSTDLDKMTLEQHFYNVFIA